MRAHPEVLKSPGLARGTRGPGLCWAPAASVLALPQPRGCSPCPPVPAELGLRVDSTFCLPCHQSWGTRGQRGALGQPGPSWALQQLWVTVGSLCLGREGKGLNRIVTSLTDPTPHQGWCKGPWSHSLSLTTVPGGASAPWHRQQTGNSCPELLINLLIHNF